MVSREVLAQSGTESIHQQELNKMVRIPNSPEAEAFAKYGDIDVSMYSGTPNISVPLYVVKGREMDLPISLTYDASGVKVDQLATWVGLNWNLNVGGRVTRIANGLPDDYIDGNYTTMTDTRSRTAQKTIGEDITETVNAYLANTSKQFGSSGEVQDYYMFLDSINKSFIDTQPDIYKISAPGLNTTIVFDVNDGHTPKSLDNPRIRVDSVNRGSRGNNEILGWTITGEDGTQYTFGVVGGTSTTAPQYELTKRDGDDNTPNGVISNEYISSWVLTQIVSPNGKDVFDFQYYDTGYWDQTAQSSTVSKATVSLEANKNYYTTLDVNEQLAAGVGYYASQQFIDNISHNGHLIATFDRGGRNDIAYTVVNTRLSDINIQDHDGYLVRKITLQNDSYFNASASNLLERRLKLDGLQIKDRNQATVQNFYFEYDRPDLLPPRTDKGQDFAGFYNGASNSVLFERYEVGDFVFEGADRTPNNNLAKIGTLNKIVYPTGGYTEYEFEGNLAEVDVNNQIDVFDLQMSLYPSDPDNESFYLDDNGNLPDDNFQPVNPKIKTKKFGIAEGDGPFTINFTGSAPDEDVEFYILKVDENFSGNNFSEYLDNSWEFNSYNKITGVNRAFAPGTYAAVLLMDELAGTTNAYGNIILTISHKENLTNTQEVDKGGLRIKTIKNYESTGVFANGKTYQYLEQEENYKPVLSEIKSYGLYGALVRSVSYPRGDEPLVTYPKVREYQIDASGNSEGYVEFTFYSDTKGQTPYYLPPFENNYFPGLKGGNIKEQLIFDDAGSKVSAQDTDYFETLQRPIKVNGLTVFQDDDHAGDWVYIKDYGGYFKGEHLQGVDCSTGTASPTYGVIFCNPLPACANNFPCNGYEALMDTNYGGLDFRKTFVHAAYGGVSVSKETLHFKDDLGNPFETTTVNETFYESQSGYYLPKETETVDSEGTIYRQTLTFPSDDPTTYSALVDKNRVMEVVASQTERLDENGNVLEFISARENEYVTLGAAILPSKIFTSKESVATLEERASFSYYSSGNLKESQQTDGPLTSYIWGYDDMYPVAKIENASATEVNGVSFSTTVLDDLSSNDAAKRAELDKIRNGLADAMVSSYTYKLGAGVSSMTDPRGYTTYFEYDDFNRLKETKDDQLKMLQEYEYAYRSDNYVSPGGDSYTALGGSIQGENPVGLNDTETYTVSPIGGSGNFSFTWYVDNVFLATNTNQIDVTFGTLGTTNVRVDVTDNVTGENLALTLDVNVSPNLGTVTLTPTPAYGLVSAQQFTFNSSGIDTSEGNLTYEWTIDNGAPEAFSGMTGFQTTFSTPGVHMVKLKVTEQLSNNTIEGEVAVEVFNPLSVSLTSDKTLVLTNGDVIFTPSVPNNNGSVVAEWSLITPSGTQVLSYTGTAPYTHTFTAAGNYEMIYKLTASQINQVQQASVQLTVTDGLSVGPIVASASDILVNESATFTKPSVSGGSSNYTYEWKVNNTVESTTSGNFTYNQFNTAGTYTISHTVTDTDLNTSDESTVTIEVHNPLATPVISPAVAHVEQNDSEYFSTTGISGGSGSRSFSWYVKLGSGSYSQVPSATDSFLTYDGFTTAGTYTLKFRVTDNTVANHYEEVESVVNVYAPIQIANSDISTPSPVQVNTTTNFTINTASGGSGSFEYEWDLINQSVTPYYYEDVGTYSEASRNVSNYNIGYSLVGASVKVQCRVHDLLTGKTATVHKIITVEDNNPISGLTIGTRDNDPDPETASYTLTANNVTGGSGSYIYRWVINGTVVQESTNNKYQSVNLSCAQQSENITCVAIDAVNSSQTVTAMVLVELGFNCNGQ